jgi:hypothetical protein
MRLLGHKRDGKAEDGQPEDGAHPPLGTPESAILDLHAPNVLQGG